jgi:hypothetical protein
MLAIIIEHEVFITTDALNTIMVYTDWTPGSVPTTQAVDALLIAEGFDLPGDWSTRAGKFFRTVK